MATGKIGHDPFGKFLATLFPKMKPDVVLTRMYFGVCVPFRLLLFTLVFVYRKEKITPWIVGLAALVSFFHLSTQPFDIGQWWSRRFQLIMSAAVLGTCFLMVSKCIEPWVLPFLLYTSVLGGLVQRAALNY